jgi:hypothetical protein
MKWMTTTSETPATNAVSDVVVVEQNVARFKYHSRRRRRMVQSSLPLCCAMTLLLLFTLVLALVPYDVFLVWGFTFVAVIPAKYHSQNWNANYDDHRNWFLPFTSLPATMYLPEDWVDDNDDSDRKMTSSSPSGSLTIPSILQSPEWVAPLARIAAEYTKRLTPTIGHINVQQIEHVSITNVAPSHVDIEAIVCENDACVSLSVPVPFTQPCLPTTALESQSQLIAPQQRQVLHLGDKSFEDCVIRNIQELDTVQLQEQATAPTAIATATSITDVSNIEYPSWWIYPGPSMEFAKECQSLLHILNEPEFQREITILVTKELYRMLNMDHDNSNNTNILQIQSALAVAVGPKGMIFRVMALYERQLEMVDVPIPFSSHGLLSIRDVEDPASLRNAVLHCIENVIP